MASLRVVVAGRAGAVVVVSAGSSVVTAGSVADAAEEAGGPAGSDWPEEGLSGWATASQMAPPTRPAAAPTTATAPRATTSMRSARRLFRLRFLFGIWNLPLFSGVNPRAAFAKELYLI